jgi:hypothetical protein
VRFGRAASNLKGSRLAPPFTSGQTLFWHGIYLAALALALFLMPGLVRSFLSFPADFDWWNRVLAVPVFNLGILCIGVARIGSRPLIKLTIAMRLWVMATLAVLVVMRVAPAVTLITGAIDLVSAVLTAWAFGAEARSRVELENA